MYVDFKIYHWRKLKKKWFMNSILMKIYSSCLISPEIEKHSRNCGPTKFFFISFCSFRNFWLTIIKYLLEQFHQHLLHLWIQARNYVQTNFLPGQKFLFIYLIEFHEEFILRHNMAQNKLRTNGIRNQKQTSFKMNRKLFGKTWQFFNSGRREESW